jgi:hypothetical protein
MTIGMTLRRWWARLTGRTMTRDQAFAAAALTAEGMHITRQLQRSPELPVSDSERQWWRQHFGPPERYVGPGGGPQLRAHEPGRSGLGRPLGPAVPPGAGGELGGLGASGARGENTPRDTPGDPCRRGDGIAGDVGERIDLSWPRKP